MSASDPNCVFVTSNTEAADIIVDWLRSQGVQAEVQTHIKESDGVMMTPFANSDTSNHLEIHIADVDRAEEIRELILSRKDDLLSHAESVDKAPPEDMVVECEACGKSSVYPGEMQGTVQECQHCGSYLDVPGGEDEFDWSIVDETQSEDELSENEDEDDSQTWG